MNIIEYRYNKQGFYKYNLKLIKLHSTNITTNAFSKKNLV